MGDTFKRSGGLKGDLAKKYNSDIYKPNAGSYSSFSDGNENQYRYHSFDSTGRSNRGNASMKFDPTPPPPPPPLRKSPKWPWIVFAVAILTALALVVLNASNNLSSKDLTIQELQESIEVLSNVASSFKAQNGVLPEEKAGEAIDAVYAASIGLPGIVRCSKDEYSVYIEVEDGLDYVFMPEIDEMDQGGSFLDIITLQPYYTENKQKNPGYDHDGLDICAAETVNSDERWLFASQNNLDDSAVTMDKILSLDNYKMILWQGHGGYNTKTGYYLMTTIPVTDELLESYTCLNKETALRTLDNTLALTPKFFKDNFSSNAFENAFIYLATCYSGKSNELANILIQKGAAVVFLNSESITRKYNLNMLHMIVESFCVGVNGPTVRTAIQSNKNYSFNSPENWTIADSLSLAQVVYGGKDPGKLLNKAEVYYLGQSGVSRMTYDQWMSNFDSSKDAIPMPTPTTASTSAPMPSPTPAPKSILSSTPTPSPKPTPTSTPAPTSYAKNTQWNSLSMQEKIWNCGSLIESILYKNPNVYIARFLSKEQSFAFIEDGSTLEWYLFWQEGDYLSVNDIWMQDCNLAFVIIATEDTVKIMVNDPNIFLETYWLYDVFWTYDWNGELLTAGSGVSGDLSDFIIDHLIVP